MQTMKKSEVQPNPSKLELKSTLLLGLLAGLLALTTESLAQNAIPAGTILPLQLNTSLNSRKAKP